MASYDDRILHLAHEKGTLSAGDVAELLGITAAYASQHLSRMKRAGTLERLSFGLYGLPRAQRVAKRVALTASDIQRRLTVAEMTAEAHRMQEGLERLLVLGDYREHSRTAVALALALANLELAIAEITPERTADYRETLRGFIGGVVVPPSAAVTF